MRGKEKEGGGRAGWREEEGWRDVERGLGRERIVEGWRDAAREG